MKRPKPEIDDGLKSAQGHSDLLAMICIGIERLVADRSVPNATAMEDVRRIKQHCTDILQTRLASAMVGRPVPRRRRDKLRC